MKWAIRPFSAVIILDDDVNCVRGFYYFIYICEHWSVFSKGKRCAGLLCSGRDWIVMLICNQLWPILYDTYACSIVQCGFVSGFVWNVNFPPNPCPWSNQIWQLLEPHSPPPRGSACAWLVSFPDPHVCLPKRGSGIFRRSSWHFWISTMTYFT